METRESLVLDVSKFLILQIALAFTSRNSYNSNGNMITSFIDIFQNFSAHINNQDKIIFVIFDYLKKMKQKA